MILLLLVMLLARSHPCDSFRWSSSKLTVESQNSAGTESLSRLLHWQDDTPSSLAPTANGTIAVNNLGEEEEEEGGPEATCGYPFARLPQEAAPDHYELLMVVDMEQASYKGVVQINLLILNDTKRLVLHADPLLEIEQIQYLELDKAGRKSLVNVTEICLFERRQLLVLSMANTIKANSRGQLQLTFAGYLSDSEFKGFYKSSYFNMNAGGPRYHAVTQFQAVEARNVFPCWDEPAFKATFNLTLVASPADRTMIANTSPLLERIVLAEPEKKQPSRKLVKFRQTPPMSTYLLAFVIGEFDFVERTINQSLNEHSREPLRLRVYTPLDRKSEGLFGLDCASRAIVEMESYFQIGYPLKKLDLISIPDFEAGAMENWGLLTFKAQQLLVNERDTSQDTRAVIAGTIVHELAHQWFGNLVTMRWWNDLWLNEGFATWLEYELADELYPEFEYQYYYLLNSHIPALNYDSFRQVHAVEPQEVIEDKPDIDGLFDSISYNKAAALIKILQENYYGTGSEPFKTALRSYIQAHQYNNTDLQGLLGSMCNAARNCSQMLDSWVRQPGHPLIRVNYLRASNTLVLSQQRFLTRTHNLTMTEMAQTWIVPLTMLLSSSSGDRIEIFQITISQQTTLVPNLPGWFCKDPTSWLKLNANFSGFYRVSYQTKMLLAMKPAIEKHQLTPADRLNLIDEGSSLLLSDNLAPSDLLRLMSWFHNEDSGAVIDVLVQNFGEMLRLYRPDPIVFKPLANFASHFLSKIYQNNYANTPNPNNKLTYNLGRSAIMCVLIDLNHTKTVEEALSNFRKSPMLDVELRRPLYAAASRHGNADDFLKLQKMFRDSSQNEERTRLINGMAKAATRDRLELTWKLLRETHNQEVATEGDNKLPILEDKQEVLEVMLGSKTGREFVLELLEKNLREVIEISGDRNAIGILEELGMSMADPEEFASRTRNLLVRHRSSSDWLSSYKQVKGLLVWQQTIARKGAPEMLRLLDSMTSSQAVK